MTDKPLNEMSEAEEADYLYAHRNDPDLAGDQVPFAPPRAARIALRLSFDEATRIRRAAEGAGMTISEFLRQVGLAAAERQVVDIERVRRDVDEVRSRIDDARQALG